MVFIYFGGAFGIACQNRSSTEGLEEKGKKEREKRKWFRQSGVCDPVLIPHLETGSN